MAFSVLSFKAPGAHQSACPIGSHSACGTDEPPAAQGSPSPQRGFHFPLQGDSPRVTSATLHWTENPTLLSLSVSRLAQSKL